MFTIEDIKKASELRSWLNAISDQVLGSGLLEWLYYKETNEIYITDREYHNDFTFPAKLMSDKQPVVAVHNYYKQLQAEETLRDKLSKEKQEKATYLKLKEKFENE